MQKGALGAIRFYQRHLSPRKGFSCAYRVHANGDSGSAYGYRVIGRHGVALGIALLGRRMDRCAQLHRRHHPAPETVASPYSARHQAGFCVLPCDIPSGDVPSCHTPGCHLGSCHSGRFCGAAWDACDLLGNLLDVRDAWRSCRRRRANRGDQDTLDIRPGPDLSDARRRNRRR